MPSTDQCLKRPCRGHMGPTTGQRRSFLTANNLPDTWVPESGRFRRSKLPLPIPIADNPTRLGTGEEGIPLLPVPIRLTGLARVTNQNLKNPSETFGKSSGSPNKTFGDRKRVLEVVCGATGPVGEAPPLPGWFSGGLNGACDGSLMKHTGRTSASFSGMRPQDLLLIFKDQHWDGSKQGNHQIGGDG